MTARTSPAPTVSPGATRTSVTVPALSVVDLVLHLHGLEDADRLADLDRVAHRHQHLDDRALHGRHDPAAPPAPRRRRRRRRRARAGRRGAGAGRRPTGGASGSHTAPRSGGRRPRRRPARRTRIGAPAAAAGRAAGRRGRRSRGGPRPTGGVRRRRRSRGARGWRRWAGMVVATPSTSVSPQGPQHAPAGLLPVVAPGDDLGDEVVVVLADGVALVVAGVDAHAEAAGAGEAGDGARATGGSARRRGPRR